MLCCVSTDSVLTKRVFSNKNPSGSKPTRQINQFVRISKKHLTHATEGNFFTGDLFRVSKNLCEIHLSLLTLTSFELTFLCKAVEVEVHRLKHSLSYSSKLKNS